MRKRKIWTAQENALLKKHYPDNLTESILKYFPDRTLSQLLGHASFIGLKKSKAFHNSPECGRITKINDIGFASRFKKGKDSWNKGKKQTDYLSPKALANVRKSQFKDGQDPHNTQAIGYERVSRDGYIEVKVQHLKNGNGNNKNFKAKHRVIYENEIGPIPCNCNVEFKDGDKLNFDVSNLVLRTKKENLINNSYCDTAIVKRFLGVKDPEIVGKVIKDLPDVIELKRNQLKLNKKIRENAKQSR